MEGNMGLQAGVSIIIPVYNSEKYISDCLASVCAEQLPNVEIICVDDGSSDQSVAIIENFQRKYSFIRIIRQEHKGAGAARNNGILSAQNKYLAFLDADDMFSSVTILNKMVVACENGKKSICGCAFWYLLENGMKYKKNVIDCVGEGLEGETEICFKDWQNDYGYTNFIFEKEFLIHNNIEFPEYKRYEDPVFFLKAMCKAGSFIAISDTLYVCRIGYKDSSEVDRSIGEILHGVKDNMEVALREELPDLRKRMITRLNNEYYMPTKRQLSDGVLERLLDINRLNKQFDGDCAINVLEDIYFGDSEKTERFYEQERKTIRHKRLFDNVQYCMSKGGGFAGYLKTKNVESVCIYGTGLYGQLLRLDLEKSGIEIVCFIDKNTEQIESGEEIWIISPKDEIPNCDMLIISLRDADDVEEEYRNKGINNVVSVMKLSEQIISTIND